MADMAKQRSFSDGRARITSIEDALRSKYGVGDLRKFAEITRGQIQSWLSDGIIEPIDIDRGVRVFNFETLAIAAIAQQITGSFPRLPPLRLFFDDLAHQLADENWYDLITAKGGKVYKVEIAGEVIDEVGEGSGTDLTVEDIGSPIGIEIGVDVGRICQRLITRILTSKGPAE